MKFVLILILATFAAAAVPGQNWQCRNDLEISCAAGKCAAAEDEGFTPMSVNFDDAGKLSVCAYTGCWEGTGRISENGSFLVLTARDLKFSTSDSAKMNRDIAITLDRTDNIALLKAGAFAQPLVCGQRDSAQGDMPAFEQYRVKVSTASPQPIKFRGNPEARMFRTRLRQANRGGVNFAGHYIFASWGCGTSCLYGAIIDTRTGNVYFPKELAGMSFGAGDIEIPEEPLQYRKDSRLFILHGYSADNDGEDFVGGVHYLVWKGTKFKRVKFVEFDRPSQ